jgi:uncharacterized protein (TIGR02145 family)
MKILLGLICLFLFLTTIIHAQGVPCPDTPTVIYLNKTYNTVLIGDQCWLKENLNVGTMIIGSQTQTDNSIIEKYCYNNDSNNCNTYGGLYQWNEAMQYSTSKGAQGICPSEWHIPTYNELMTLAFAVETDGNALKEIGQGSGNGAGTNTSGFSALLAGFMSWDGSCYSLGSYAYFWTSTEADTYNAFLMYLFGDGSGINGSNDSKYLGYSIRCVKDYTVGVKDIGNLELRREFILLQNYPNPFNPITTFSFAVPHLSHVTITATNVLGQQVATIIDKEYPAGNYNQTWDAHNLPSGIYFYKMQVDGKFSETRKLVLLR